MSGVKWISIATDIFNDEKMCAIESMPNGMMMELIWIKILCLAGTCNEDGLLVVTKGIPYTAEMLATNFRLELSVVQQALSVFMKMGMVDKIDGTYLVCNWLKHQNNVGLSHIREVNRLRQQRYRERQKALLNEQTENREEEKRNVTVTLQSNVTSHDFCSICNMSYLDVYKEVLDYLNNKTDSSYRYTTKKNQTLIHARLEDGYVIEDFKKVIDTKCDEWMGTDMQKFLRPETLFGNKFEGYLNQKTNSFSNSTSAFDSIVV